MKMISGNDIVSTAGCLCADEIHVWLLPYKREQKREPLIRLLGAYLNVSADQVKLVEGEFGRPFLDSIHGSALGFNWSHSGDHALVAVGHDLVPGIDIERRRPRTRALEIAEHYFHKEEVAALLLLPSDRCSDAFLSLWTAKEAILKAVGRGIAYGLDRLHVTSTGSQLELRWLDGDIAEAWQLHRIDVGENYMAAIAWRGEARRLRCWTIDLKRDGRPFRSRR